MRRDDIRIEEIVEQLELFRQAPERRVLHVVRRRDRDKARDGAEPLHAWVLRKSSGQETRNGVVICVQSLSDVNIVAFATSVKVSHRYERE